MNRVVLALALVLGVAGPASGACSKSPFSGIVTCDYDDTYSDPFANERIEWPKKTHCVTHRDYYGNLVTDCTEQ